MRSPNFSTLRQAWNGSCNSDPLITILGKSSKCTYTQKKNEVTVTSTTHLFLHSTPTNRNPVPGSCCGSLTAYKACIRQNLWSCFPLCFSFPYFTEQSQNADCHLLCRPCTFWKYCSTHCSSSWNTSIFSSVTYHLSILAKNVDCMHDFRIPAQCKWGLLLLWGVTQQWLVFCWLVTTNQCCITSQKNEALQTGLFT